MKKMWWTALISLIVGVGLLEAAVPIGHFLWQTFEGPNARVTDLRNPEMFYYSGVFGMIGGGFILLAGVLAIILIVCDFPINSS